MKPLPLAPLLEALDGKPVPPQLLRRDEDADALYMCELFQPLREYPRDASAALAAALQAEYEGSDGEEEQPAAAPSAVSFLRGGGASSSSSSSKASGGKERSKDKAKERPGAAAEGKGFSLAGLFKGSEAKVGQLV